MRQPKAWDAIDMRRPDAKRGFVPATPHEESQALPNAWWAQLWGWRSAGVATGLGGCVERKACLYREATCTGAQSAWGAAIGAMVEEAG